MATTYGTQMTKILNTTPPTFVHAGDMHGRLRIFNEKITAAAQAAADIIYCARVPKHARILGLSNLHASVTMGAAATLAVGVVGTAAKYRTAAIVNSTAPFFFDVVANLGEELTAKEDLIITIGAAALPGAGTLRACVVYVVD